MCIFNCNLVATPSAPLISTSNIGVPSDESSGADMFIYKQKRHQVKRQIHHLCFLFVHFQLLYHFVTFVQHRVAPHVHVFIDSFSARLCPNKCTTMHIFKCNSIVILRSPLILTSNASLCRSKTIPQVCIQMNPQWHPQLHCQMKLQVHHQVQRQMRPFCHLLIHWIFKVNSQIHLQV